MEIPFSPERRAQGRSSFQKLADEAGLEYGDRGHWYDGQPAHEANLWAEAQGHGDDFKRAVFRAYFIHDLNIGSADLLAELAMGLGLDSDDLRRALSEGQYRGAITAQYTEARKLGVTAVPTFVAEGYALVGAHPIENLRKLLDHAGAQRKEGQPDGSERRFTSGNLLGPELRRQD
ncbi:MAG: hypothetical protein EPO26_13900 [Chloroflexota bacterium]|nr:MAG: hypothetical protein EPO26_13900 [Chloroflexota bacterium]